MERDLKSVFGAFQQQITSTTIPNTLQNICQKIHRQATKQIRSNHEGKNLL
jgi:hypothetical protein